MNTQSTVRDSKTSGWKRKFTRFLSLNKLPASLVQAANDASHHAGKLFDFGQLTDREFVVLAETVSSIQESIQNIATQADNLKASLDGNAEENAFHAAFDVGKRSIELVHSSTGVEFALNNQFELIDELVQDCQTIKDEFDQNQVTFRFLATGFAIESARCDIEHQAVFKTVVSDFHRIDSSITKTLEGGFSELQSVLKEMDSIRRSWNSETGGANNTIDAQLERIRQEIHRIETLLAPCVIGCDQIKDALENIELALSPIIVCLQNQDIVRQKLEHVATALDQIQDLANVNSAGHTRRERIGELFAHASVQSKQLDYALNLLSDAADQAFGGINQAQSESVQVANQLDELQNRLHRQFGTGDVAFAFGKQIQELSNITEFSESIQEKLADIDTRIVKVVEVYNKEINSRQQDIRLIALNAQVAASRLEEGGALERLAQETSIVAEANRQTSSKLSNLLSTALEKLRFTREASLSHVETLNLEKSTLFESSKNIDLRLRNHICETIRETKALVSQTASNNHTIKGLAGRLSFPRLLDSAFEPMKKQLSLLQDASRKALGRKGVCDGVKKSMDGHRARYTMHTERALHDETFSEISERETSTTFF